MQIANEILDGKDMPHDWKTSKVVPIYKKLLDHSMKVVESLLEKRLRRLVKVYQMQCKRRFYNILQAHFNKVMPLIRN